MSNTSTGALSVGVTLGGETSSARLTKLEQAVTALDTQLHETAGRVDHLSDEEATNNARSAEIDQRMSSMTEDREQLETRISDMLANIERLNGRLAEISVAPAEELSAQIAKLTGDVDNLLAASTTPVAAVTAGGSIYDEKTPEFPNGFMAYVAENYYRSDMLRYMRSLDDERRRREAEAQANSQG